VAEEGKEPAPLELRIVDSFARDYRRLPDAVRTKADEQIVRLLRREFHHPSLGFKKMRGTRDIWEARVTRNYRITLHLEPGRIVLRRIGTHDVLEKP